MLFSFLGQQIRRAGHRARDGGLLNRYSAGSEPLAITAGPDGNLWFTKQATSRIARINLSGHVRNYRTTTPGSPRGIATGPDGNLWFTEPSRNRIGQITLAGAITLFHAPIADSFPGSLTAGPDGNLWFTAPRAQGVGSIAPDGTFGPKTRSPAATPTPTPSRLVPMGTSGSRTRICHGSIA